MCKCVRGERKRDIYLEGCELVGFEDQFRMVFLRVLVVSGEVFQYFFQRLIFKDEYEVGYGQNLV